MASGVDSGALPKVIEMAERWVATPRKRLILRVLDLLARIAPSAVGPDTGRPAADSERVRDILVVELWNIGDIVLTLPFLAQLRAKFPEARLTLLGRPYAREVLEGTGLIDDYIETDLAWSGHTTRLNPLGYRWGELRRVRNQLVRRRFDIAFKARMHVREHVLLALSRARRTVAYALGAGDSVLTDALTRPDSERHKTDDWLGLLAPLGGTTPVAAPQLRVSAIEREWAARYLGQRGIGVGDVVVGIHPGASFAEKRWPMTGFAEVARALAGQPGVRVLAFADPEGYGSELGEIPGVTLARVSLRQMMALIERCRLLICNDSGPMHLAGAMGVPVVALFGSGIAPWFSPLGEGHVLLTPDSDGDASEHGDIQTSSGVSRIPVARVLDTVNRWLRSPPVTPG
ncbi:MAG: glycosyltransferase family 9 protein [Gemmatimonadaceae bacterium]